jgi:uridylate kinase
LPARRTTSARKDGVIVVIKLSGSLFFSDHFDPVMKTLAEAAARKRPSTRLVLVCGGGSTARKYIEAARNVGVDGASLDEIGIEVSRLNAIVTADALGGLALREIPKDLAGIAEAVENLDKKRIVVTGGLHPGQSTNAVGALVAEKLGAREFVNATDVEGVFDRDPRRFSNAKLLHSVTVAQLEKILKRESMSPGAYDLMDLVALKLIERSKIKTTIVKCDAPTLRAVLRGKAIGTKIVFS